MYPRLFLHVLGHANLEHYVNNMMMMLLVGPMLEEKYGSKNLLIMMAITAFVTGIINTLFFSTGLLGASGIVFMMIILSSVTSVKEDNISQLTHIVGGICGGVFGLTMFKDC